MGAEVHVLVTCTNRKTVSPLAALTLRAVPGRTPADRADVWVDRLQTTKTDHITAESLYAGDHWQVVRSMPISANRVWVCSAGYGLIPLSAKLASYAATFTPNHPDSVTRKTDMGEARTSRRAWWKTLSRWVGPDPEAPRTIYDLASRRKNSILIVAASPRYLDALEDDLTLAASVLGTERLAIFSAGSNSHPTLAPYLVPCDARLQATLGGSLTSLNARCVRYALEQANEDGLRLTPLRERFVRLLREQPARIPSHRTPLSDEEVCVFIQTALEQDETIRPTPLLVRLRDAGRACEQSRFCALFRKMEGGRRD